MIAVPAVDLREGACVQLVGGSFDAERVRVADPVAKAQSFAELGFQKLHVVDLDAAMGRGDNDAVVDGILQSSAARVTVGGGVRSLEKAARLLGRGAARVVVGTRAIEDRAFLDELVAAQPGRIVLALDVRGREVVTRGWQSGAGKTVAELLGKIRGLDLAGLLVTAVHVEGTLAGVDADLYREVLTETAVPVIASGGIGSMEDLRTLASIGCAEAVTGMALYTGAIDAAAVAKEFGT